MIGRYSGTMGSLFNYQEGTGSGREHGGLIVDLVVRCRNGRRFVLK